jgi:hypothetical protein
MTSCVRFLCCGIFLLISVSAFAADQDDLYFEMQFGPRWESNTKFQAGGVAGYLPVDSVGFGLGVDESFTTVSGDKHRAMTQYYVEGRWFVEPLEIAGGAGFQQFVALDRNVSNSPLLLSTMSYLMAVSSSLALKAEIRGQFLLKESANIFTGLGFRFIY